MSLSPEERKRIYEEEKARIEAEEKQKPGEQAPTTELKSNVAGLLCYLGGWITGIIFLMIEQRDRFVRFHALQSIITFGSLMIAWILLGWIPVVGGFFGVIIGVTTFVLWVVLMVKAYQGELYKLPVAGDVAAGVLDSSWLKKQAAAGQDGTPEPVVKSSKKAEDFGRRVDNYFKGSHAGRVVGYSIAIFWNVAVLVFFSFFHKYIAWYHTGADGTVTRLSLLTDEYFLWLPILITAVVITITGNIIMIIYDRYWVRSVTEMILNLVSIIVIANLVVIFPFNLDVIPNSGLSEALQVGLPISLIFIAVVLGIAVIVQFVKLIVYMSGGRNTA